MTALAVVEPLDVVKHTASSVCVRVEHLYAKLSFERSKKALHHGVIPTVALSAHTRLDLGRHKHRLIVTPCVLTTTITAVEQTGTWRSAVERVVQGT